MTSSLCCYSQSSVMGAPRPSAALLASFNDIISIGELIKSVKEGNVGIKKIAEKSGIMRMSTIRIVWWRQTAVRLNMVRVILLC